MTPTQWVRFALGYLIIVTVPVGAWALAAPRSFHDSFPGFGRAWVSIDGPFNEHLVRDVGALNLSLAVLLVVAWIRLRPEVVALAGAASLVWGVPHAAYHATETDGLGNVDRVLNVGGLALFVILGGGLVWMSRRLDDLDDHGGREPAMARQQL